MFRYWYLVLADDLLTLAAVFFGLRLRDEVITTLYSFIASSNMILYQGATPVFVDIDPGTLNIDPSHIEAAITGRTKTILPVHHFGQPADMDPKLVPDINIASYSRLIQFHLSRSCEHSRI
jgi:dTDP-4-amino-4,6-dideoxygalactose transaminase